MGATVKASTAGDIPALPEIGGALVGGASLKAADFEAIISVVPTKSLITRDRETMRLGDGKDSHADC